MKSESDQGEVTRRGFLRSGLALLGGVVSLVAFVAATLRLPLPALLPGRSLKFRIGEPKQFPPGTVRFFDEQQCYVVADRDGIYAISATCTHLGCVVHREEDRFACPCHGSIYDPDGKVIQGPAPRNLPWFSVRESPGGRLVVDRGEVVPSGTKYLV